VDLVASRRLVMRIMAQQIIAPATVTTVRSAQLS
jgi:hypothetical protein